jgi:hypothetical protein
LAIALGPQKFTEIISGEAERKKAKEEAEALEKEAAEKESKNKKRK